MYVLKTLKMNARLVFISLLFAIVSAPSYADQAYSDGFSAYLDGDYQAAQTHWLKSAKAGNSKSMFNLGLLHEQNKIKNAKQLKAYEWYRLSGDSGYLAADYHFSKILLASRPKTQKDIDEANRLMKRAANNGFLLADEHINGKKNNITKSNLTKSNVRKSTTNKSVPNTNKVVSNKKPSQGVNSSTYLTESWVMSKRPNYWTIQILAFTEKRKVEAFIDKNKLKNKAAYFKERSKNGIVYKLVFGVYKTKIQADFARQNLAKALTEHGPWLRSIKSVQSVIKAQ